MEELFDTLRYKHRAIMAGLTDDQAEFHAEEIASLLNEHVVTLSVLREELLKLETRMRTFQYQLTGAMLGGIVTFLTVSEAIIHILVLR